MPSRGPSTANRRREQTPPRAKRRSPTPLVGALVGMALGAGALGALTWSSGCAKDDDDRDARAEPAGSADPFGALPSAPVPEEANAPVVEEPDPPAQAEKEAEKEEEEKPWEGPWLGALAHSTPIYPTARFSKNRMGYIRKGGKVPVRDEPIKTKSCKQGFYPLVDGGYVCGKYSTTNLEDARFKMGIRQPDTEALLPYKYAYNKAHGTPLYISVPSKEEMLAYEPYLQKKDKKSAGDKARDKAEAKRSAEMADQPRDDEIPPEKSPVDAPAKADGDDEGKTKPASDRSPSKRAAEDGDGKDGGLQFLSEDLAEGSGGGEAEEPKTPWWEKDSVDVKLSDLDEKDGTISKRMVKGFFIAVDRTFGWNDRLWYKTTDGLIAPTDRMIIPKTPELQGMEMTGDIKQVGFMLWRKGSKYEWPEDADAPKRAGRVERFTPFGLTGKTRIYNKERFRETVDGWWFKEKQGTITDAGPRPEEVGEDEKWIDVDLGEKTLVAFVGDDPVYAALTSPGKRSSNPAKDHRTKTGKWRIREKHVTTTMDGDGPAGDLPYSIQDVPYVQYYDGSYALHGAFWHHNFGREKSHGCVNLSPRDAKHLFFWTEPSLPRGWHGVWSSDKRKGTLVVVHE
jgi:hypothetical protein